MGLPVYIVIDSREVNPVDSMMLFKEFEDAELYIDNDPEPQFLKIIENDLY